MACDVCDENEVPPHNCAVEVAVRPVCPHSGLAVRVCPVFTALPEADGMAMLWPPERYYSPLVNGQIKAYGAGLLSSYDELEYCLSDKPVLKNFDPYVTGDHKYPITQYQPVYFVTESFDEVQQRLREFAQSIPRPFAVRYNPYTQSIEILNSKVQLESVARNIQSELQLLLDAMKKINN